jgi:hypothetical protein
LLGVFLRQAGGLGVEVAHCRAQPFNPHAYPTFCRA